MFSSAPLAAFMRALCRGHLKYVHFARRRLLHSSIATAEDGTQVITTTSLMQTVTVVPPSGPAIPRFCCALCGAALLIGQPVFAAALADNHEAVIYPNRIVCSFPGSALGDTKFVLACSGHPSLIAHAAATFNGDEGLKLAVAIKDFSPLQRVTIHPPG